MNLIGEFRFDYIIKIYEKKKLTITYLLFSYFVVSILNYY